MDWIGILIVIILCVICVILALGGVAFLCGFEMIYQCHGPEALLVLLV